jgi:hypothetical protein
MMDTCISMQFFVTSGGIILDLLAFLRSNQYYAANDASLAVRGGCDQQLAKITEDLQAVVCACVNANRGLVSQLGMPPLMDLSEVVGNPESLTNRLIELSSKPDDQEASAELHKLVNTLTWCTNPHGWTQPAPVVSEESAEDGFSDAQDDHGEAE